MPPRRKVAERVVEQDQAPRAVLGVVPGRVAARTRSGTSPAQALAAYARLPATHKLALLVTIADAACDTDLAAKAAEDELVLTRIKAKEIHNRNRGHVRRLFEKMDKDGSGALDINEFKEVGTLIEISLSDRKSVV